MTDTTTATGGLPVAEFPHDNRWGITFDQVFTIAPAPQLYVTRDGHLQGCPDGKFLPRDGEHTSPDDEDDLTGRLRDCCRHVGVIADATLNGRGWAEHLGRLDKLARTLDRGPTHPDDVYATVIDALRYAMLDLPDVLTEPAAQQAARAADLLDRHPPETAAMQLHAAAHVELEPLLDAVANDLEWELNRTDAAGRTARDMSERLLKWLHNHGNPVDVAELLDETLDEADGGTVDAAARTALLSRVLDRSRRRFDTLCATRRLVLLRNSRHLPLAIVGSSHTAGQAMRDMCAGRAVPVPAMLLTAESGRGRTLNDLGPVPHGWEQLPTCTRDELVATAKATSPADRGSSTSRAWAAAQRTAADTLDVTLGPPE